MFFKKLFTGVSFSLTLLTLCTPAPLAQDRKPLNSQSSYSISDLEVLQQAHAFKEFFKHAHDILPTQRTKYWLDMVSDMAQSFIDDSFKQDNFDSLRFSRIEELAKWPELRGDEFYQVKRSRYALSYFKVCLSSGKLPNCKKQMHSFWKSAKKEAETGYKLLEYFAGFFPKHNNWPLLKSILTKPEGRFYCAKPLVTGLTFNHLEKLHLYTDPPHKVVLYLSQMSTKRCWKEIAGSARTWLDQTSTSQTKSLFVALKASKELDPIQEGLWLTRYYLSAPSPGKLLNRAWSQLEVLASNFGQRKKVLHKLADIDPLPGTLFENLGEKRSRVLFEHLSQSFPEYVQLYSKTCIAYREGTRLFARGNPTIQCQKLMAYDKKQKRKQVSQEVHLRYSATLKGLKGH